MARIWLGEDDDVMRAGVCEFLEKASVCGARPEVEPFWELGQLQEALRKAKPAGRPDVLIQDLQMGGGNLVDLATVMEGTNPTFPVIRQFVEGGIPVIVLANLPAGVSREREPEFWSDIKEWTGAKWALPKAIYRDRPDALISALEKVLCPPPEPTACCDCE